MVRPTKDSAASILVFLLKVAALEVLRRGTKIKCPQLWWGLQGLPLLQAPGLSWLQKWAPLRFMINGTQVFSKPILFLSLATTISNALEEQKDATLLARIFSSDSQDVNTLRDLGETSQHLNNTQLLCHELEKEDVHLPTRLNNDELGRFLVATNGNIETSIEKVKKTIKWRDTYYFLSASELKHWLHLVFWHGYDAKLRPTLILRLGKAYSTLLAHQRPQFVQAIVSQVEFGILNLLHPNDPRITVIMDCKGVSVNGFAMHLTKSCCILFKEHYPTRLAALVAVNFPDTLGDIASAILKILEPATRQKICLAGEDYTQVLEEFVGGLGHISLCLAGQCRCTICDEALIPNNEQHRSVDSRASITWNSEDLEREEGMYPVDHSTSFESCTAVIRFIIIGFLILWVVVALVFGLRDLQIEAIPT
ncbi:hypothetical protein O6H91_21G069200 [Diphasiastrum complanatum]|nr:hypothetical protein O6H91_21G069200 [Diphasiastrum complanatum]